MECCSWSTFKQMQRGSKNAQTHVHKHKHAPPGYLSPCLTSLKTNFPLEAPDWCFCLACTDTSAQGLSSISNKFIKLQLNERRFPSAVNRKHPCRLAVEAMSPKRNHVSDKSGSRLCYHCHRRNVALYFNILIRESCRDC